MGGGVPIDQLVDQARNNFRYKDQIGAFYGSAEGRALGVGLVYANVRYPQYDPAAEDYATLEGNVYVLTHECDIDQDNARAFDDHVLIIPIVDFADWADEFRSVRSEGELAAYIPDLAGDRVFRACYLPPAAELPNGGIMPLNNIASAHISEFTGGRAQPLCALSEYAKNIVDMKIENHLLRPKTDPLPRLK